MTREEKTALKNELKYCIDELYFLKRETIDMDIKRIKEIFEELGDIEDVENLYAQVDEWFEDISSKWCSM